MSQALQLERGRRGCRRVAKNGERCALRVFGRRVKCDSEGLALPGGDSQGVGLCHDELRVGRRGMGNDQHAGAQVGNADGRGLRLPDSRGIKNQDVRREQADSCGFCCALDADCGRRRARVVCGQGDDPLRSPFADGVKRQVDLCQLRHAQIKGQGG